MEACAGQGGSNPPPRATGAKPWQWLAVPKDGSVVTLAEWLGHSSPTITLDHCAHFVPEAGRKGRRAIVSLLGERTEERSHSNSQDSPQDRS